MDSNSNCPDVSIVIPTKNGGELFYKVLERLQEQDYSGNIEIIIIDSSSSDKTVEFAYKFNTKVKVIAPEDFNHGLTRNHGIELSTGQIVILMTQDALPANNKLIHYLVAAFDDPMVGGVYAQQIAQLEADVLTKRNLENWLTGRKSFAISQINDTDAYNNMSAFEKYTVCNFDNVCSAVRRSAWQKAPFRKNDFGEDIEWGLRILTSGWKIAYQPAAAVIHSHNRSVMYEYKRTYMCHRKLYELFGLQCIPSLKFVVRSFAYSVATDWLYVLQNEFRPLQKLKLMLRVPALSMASVWGQYRGAKDEKLGRGKKVSGV